MKSRQSHDQPAGLPGDPIEFMAMAEIAIISHLADNLFARVLPQELTRAQFGVLNHLLRLQTQETIGELASAMQVSQPTMSSTVRKLEEKGCITLEADPHDRRIKRVTLAPVGRKMRERAIECIAPLQVDLAAQLSKSEWAALLPLLTKLRIVLDEERR